jgi:GWxTD domain-containing protein
MVNIVQLISLFAAATGPAVISLTAGLSPNYQPQSAFCSLADSIFALTDIAELERVVDIAQHGAHRLDPEANARAAVAAFRLAHADAEWLTLKRALSFLDRAAGRYREDPCFFYHRGAIRREYGAQEPFSPNPWQKSVRGDVADKAIKDFRKAAELQPDWFSPVAAMAELTLTAYEDRLGRRPRWRRWTFAAIDAYVAAGGREPEAALWRGRMRVALDSLELALADFRSYSAATNSGMAQLEQARALFALGRDEEATRLYWQATTALGDSSVAAEMGRDLHYIFDPLERVEWNQLESGGRRTAWVGQFWNRRCARDLVTYEERIAEHYARLHHARLNYRRFRQAVRTSNYLFDVPDHEDVDDRGVVYVRLGPPYVDERCSARVSSCGTWIYQAADGRPMALHFSTYGADGRLITALPPEEYWRLGRHDPYYYSLGWRMATRNPATSWTGWLDRLELTARQRQLAERTVNQVLITDHLGLRLDYDLDFGYEWLFFQGERPGTVEATLAMAVPRGDISCQPTDAAGSCTLLLRTSIFARDSTLFWRDLLGTFEVADSAGDVLYGHIRILAGPGTWSYRMALFEPVPGPEGSLHGNWGGGQTTIPVFSDPQQPDRVSVSSLVVARPGTGGWIRAGEALALNPLHTYPTGASLELYYEIYGIREFEVFFTDLLLLEGDPPLASIDPPQEWIDSVVRGGRSALQLRFEESASYRGAPWVQLRKTLTLSDIRPGRYTLVLATTLSDLSTTIYRATPILVQPGTD